jgi:hypothetical protein
MSGLTNGIRGAAGTGALAAAAGAAAGLIDPIRTNHLSSALQKAQPALLIPLALAVTAVAALLLRRAAPGSRIGLAGLILTGAGTAGVVIAACASLLTSKDHVLGPIFGLGAVFSSSG